MTDNVAILDGYTESYIAESDDISLYILVKPETDFDSTFKAWDTDNQEYIRINGWLFTFEPDNCLPCQDEYEIRDNLH